MILLIGGTSETGSLASALAAWGLRVLVSTASDVPLDTGDHPNISRRSGVLDETKMLDLVRDKHIRIIVDASHPYAELVRATARRVANQAGIPYVTWLRPSALDEDREVIFAETHEAAAHLACSFGTPVLLTIGSRNLGPYARQAAKIGVAVVARVLDHPDSVAACRAASIPDERCITGRGPFSVDDNVSLITRFAIGVLVTKDSGAAGGVTEKLEAARRCGCHIVVVRRPQVSANGVYGSIRELVAAVRTALSENLARESS